MKNLKALRKSADMTLQELADELGTSNQVLSRYERGERQADYETLAKIARFFNVSIDYLLDFQAATKSNSDTQTIEERELLSDFRKLPSDLQHRASKYMSRLVEVYEEERQHAPATIPTPKKKIIS